MIHIDQHFGVFNPTTGIALLYCYSMAIEGYTVTVSQNMYAPRLKVS